MRHVTRILMLGYVVAFAVVDASTVLFQQYPPLFWLGALGVLAVFVSTARCARSQWRQLREGTDGTSG